MFTLFCFQDLSPPLLFSREGDFCGIDTRRELSAQAGCEPSTSCVGVGIRRAQGSPVLSQQSPAASSCCRNCKMALTLGNLHIDAFYLVLNRKHPVSSCMFKHSFKKAGRNTALIFLVSLKSIPRRPCYFFYIYTATV